MSWEEDSTNSSLFLRYIKYVWCENELAEFYQKISTKCCTKTVELETNVRKLNKVKTFRTCLQENVISSHTRSASSYLFRPKYLENSQSYEQKLQICVFVS